MLGCALQHIHEADGEEVLPGEDVDAWEVAHLLVELQPDEQFGVDVLVRPEHVPGGVGLHAVEHFPAQFLGHFLDDVVLGD